METSRWYKSLQLQIAINECGAFQYNHGVSPNVGYMRGDVCG